MPRTRAAILATSSSDIEIVSVELDEPRTNELMVKVAAAGLCHSDLHLISGAQNAAIYPFGLGHEGAGEVVAVGPGTSGWAVGDHVIFSFVPVCGRCRWCATGRGNLCDQGALVFSGARPDAPGTFRMSLDGRPVGQMCGLSTFSELTTVSTMSAIKIDPSLPLDRMCLLGCGVSTGWGSAVNAGSVRPGQTVIVCGIGGVGTGAIQGAAGAGAYPIIAVDRLPEKVDAALRFGATHGFTSMAEATEFAQAVTNGQGADATILTVGVVDGPTVESGIASIRKGGTLVLTAVGARAPTALSLPLLEITTYEKRIVGSLFGSANPFETVPRLIQEYRDGRLNLDQMITRRYALEEISEGFDAMSQGRNIRGIVTFD